MISSNIRITVTLALAISVLAACGGSNGGAEGGSSGLGGQIEVTGSSTVEPITSLVAEKFQSSNPQVSISVAGPGTSDGFALFCEGEAPVVDASRAIADEEVAACKKNNVTFHELKIAIDGLSVLTSPENGEVTCLDPKDLYALLGPESEGFDSWSDANSLAQKIGAGHAPYPDEELVITAPGEESGTWGSFVDLVLKDIGEERGFDEVATRPDYQSSANDNVIIEGIQSSPYSLGWVGFAFYEQNIDATKAIEIDAGDGTCVAPSAESIADGSYPLARDLYIYVNSEQAESNEAVAAFVDFYLSEEGLLSVTEVGYVAQPPDQIAQAQATWQERRLGSVESG